MIKHWRNFVLSKSYLLSLLHALSDGWSGEGRALCDNKLEPEDFSELTKYI